MSARTMTRTALLATFWVGDTRLAIDAQRVQEVLKDQSMVKVPGTDPSIRGLVNLRGQVIVAIELAVRMEIAMPPGHRPSFSVVVRTPEGPVILLVDRVGEVLDASELDADPAPDTLDEALHALITGVHQREADLLLVLDVDKATAVKAHRDETAHKDGEASASAAG
jgi:purine-binding chemotaxis protein CheW